MTVDEISARLRARLQEEYGVDEAAILMDRPPGGWGDLVTNQSLDRRLLELERRLDLKFDARFEAVSSKFESIDTRFASIDARFDAVDAKFDAMDAKFDARFDETNARFDLKLETLEHRLTSAMDRGFKDQTWRLITAMLSAMAVLMVAIAALMVVAAR